MWQKIITVTALAAMQLGMVAPVYAAIDLAKIPLIASTGSQPKPNLMLTVDTSGSMSWRHMPQSSATVNGYSVTLKGDGRWFHHPNDTYENDASGTDWNKTTVWARTDLPDESSDLLEQIKFRSPDINTIYYNPRIRYQPWAKADGQRYPAAVLSKAYIDPLKQDGTSVDLSKTFTLNGVTFCAQYFFGYCTKTQLAVHHPGIYYLLKDGQDPNKTKSYDVYDVNDKAVTSFNSYPDRSDCSEKSCTPDQERQNFANWFVYYRTRMLSTKAALSEAFFQTGDVVRVGWTTIRHAEAHRWKNDASPIIQGVKDLTDSHRQALLDAIQGKTKPDTQSTTKPYFSSEGTTPLRIALDEVGKYFQRSANYSPWENAPTDIPSKPSTAGKFSGGGSICRRSYNMLATDGYYNEVLSDSDKVGDLDGQDTANYKLANLYRDRPATTGYSNTLADFALKYWATDLSPLEDGIKPTSYEDRTLNQTINNPATWQHLTQFTVSLGVAGKLPTTEATFNALKTGTLSWPDPSVADAHKIDDLWHAAVNTRGAYYNVRTAQDLEQAVTDMLNKAQKQPLREAGVATSAIALQTANIKFVPEYDRGVWAGDFYAYQLNKGKVVSYPEGIVKENPTPKWSASGSLPAAAARNIKTSGWNNGSPTLLPFVYQATSGTQTDMGADNRNLMGSSASNELVNYLRGDRSKEGSASNAYRKRNSVLADIINSTPVLAKDGLDAGYGSSNGYSDFLLSKANRSNPMVFVGSNGGMLHAFDAATGTEQFAFVPRGVLPELYRLAQQSYALSTSSHRFYVDGPLTEADALLSGQWQNLLIGSLGAGGKGLFALNLPVSSTSGTEPTLMWDLTGEPPSNATVAQTEVARDIGQIFSKAEVGRLPDGSWKVFVGNGINSSNDRAALLMIDVASGNVTSLPASTDSANGLTGIAVVRNANKDVVAVYGGDLQGKLWRFEYNSGSSAMVLGHSGRPLYKATSTDGTAQPITAAPAVTQGDKGQVVLFGTGQLLAESDRGSTQQQAFYGIVDEIAADQPSSTTPSSSDPVVSRADLKEQTISKYSSDSASSSPYTFLNVSSVAQDSDSKGWTLKLEIPAIADNPDIDYPRVIYEPILVGDFVLITAISPAPNAAECATSNGRAYDFLLPATTGAQYDKPVFDTNGSGLVTTDGSDSNAAGAVSDSMGRRTILTGERDSNGKRDISIQTGNGDLPGADWLIKKTSAILDRVWQRIQPPPDRTPPPPAQ